MADHHEQVVTREMRVESATEAVDQTSSVRIGRNGT